MSGHQPSPGPLAEADAGAQAPPPRHIAWYSMGVLILVALFATVDRQIFGLVAEPIRVSLSLSDTQLGLLQGVGGILITAVAAFPLGWLADRYDRRVVLAFSVLFWSVACAARGFAANFGQLFAATLALSAGEAGVVPAIYGIIPTLFEKKKRPLANSVYVVSLYLAASAGLALCGALVAWLAVAQPGLPAGLHQVETWRVALILLAVPGPIVAILLLTIPRRRRSGADGGAATGKGAAAGVGLIQYIRTHRVAVLGVCIGSGVIAVGAAVRLWSPIIAAREFGASPAEVGAGLGAAGGLGWAAGFLVTVLISRRFAPGLGTRFAPRVLWVGALASAVVSACMLLADDAKQFFILVGVQAAIETAGSIVSPTLLQELGPAHLRSRLISLCMVVAMAINALMPILVGAISDALGPVHHGLLTAAVIVGVAGTLGASLIFALTETPYKRTADAVA